MFNGILRQKILRVDIRPRVVRDCVNLIDDEVAEKNFLVQAGYKTFKALMPDKVENSVNFLLDDFVLIFDEFYSTYQNRSIRITFSSWLDGRKLLVAKRLLSVTDQIVQSAGFLTRQIYDSMRKGAEKDVALAIPKVGAIIQKYLMVGGQPPPWVYIFPT